MKKIRKVNRVMKISALLSLAFACTVSASTYGQNYKLSMNKQDYSISEMLKEIEKKSEYTLYLNDNQVNENRKTSEKAKTNPKKHHFNGCFFGFVVFVCVNGNTLIQLSV